MDGLNLAERLFTEGRVDEAISVLEVDIERHETPEKLVRLMQMRHSGFFHKPLCPACSPWPPETVGSQFPQGIIPEIPASALDVSLLTQGVINHGALIVRNLFDRHSIQELTDCIERAMQAYDHLAGSQTTNEWFTPLRPCPQNGETRVARKWVREGGGVLAADSPKAMFKLIKILKNKQILHVIGDYLGEPPALSVKKTTLRRVAPDSKGGWHQDGAFLGQGIRTLNLWVALSDCGVDAPSMDMIPARLDRILPTGQGGADFGWSVGDEFVTAGGVGFVPVRLRFSAGDAIFFDEMNLHRTAADETMTLTRYAIEAWFFAPSSYPLGQIPIVC